MLPRSTCSRALQTENRPKSNRLAEIGLAIGARHALDQVPASRPDEQRRDLVVQPVRAPSAVVCVSVPRTASRSAAWPPTTFVERRREGVLEIGHEHVRTRVERVDHHARLGRARDLHPAALEVGRGRGYTKIGLGRCPERRPLAGVERRLALDARREQRTPARRELALEALDQVERIGREDVVAERDGRGQRQRHEGRSSATHGFRRTPTPSSSTSTTSPSRR